MNFGDNTPLAPAGGAGLGVRGGRGATAAAVLALLLAAGAAAQGSPPDAGVELTGAIRTIPELHRANPDSPYALADGLTHQGVDRLGEQLELHAHPGPLTLAWTGMASGQHGLAPSRQGVFDEAWLDADAGGVHWSIGKKVQSWDVGQGFRPLDVVQQEDRRALYTYALEGIPAIVGEVFDDRSAWTLVVANPGRSLAAAPRDDGSLALRYYRRLGGVDAYAVGRYSRRDRAQAGASMSWVAEEHTEWHASLLYQRRAEQVLNSLALAPSIPLATGDPGEVRARHDAPLALAGGTWTDEAGLSLLAEAWYDGTAYRKSDWDALRGLDARQLALLGRAPTAAIAGNLAFSSRYYEQSNLLRGNLLLRASRKIDKFTPALDLLATPADGGLVATASCAFEGDRVRVDAGWRLLTGRPGSAYRQAAERQVAYAGLSLYF